MQLLLITRLPLEINAAARSPSQAWKRGSAAPQLLFHLLCFHFFYLFIFIKISFVATQVSFDARPADGTVAVRSFRRLSWIIRVRRLRERSVCRASKLRYNGTRKVYYIHMRAHIHMNVCGCMYICVLAFENQWIRQRRNAFIDRRTRVLHAIERRSHKAGIVEHSWGNVISETQNRLLHNNKDKKKNLKKSVISSRRRRRISNRSRSRSRSRSCCSSNWS